MGPMSAVADFQYLLPKVAQRAPGHMSPEEDSTTEYLWDPDLGSLRPVAPIKGTADKWSTTPSLVFPPMDPLTMLEWNEGREVKSTLTRGKLQLTMFSGLIQGPNTNSSSQCEIIPRVTYHTPFYFSTMFLSSLNTPTRT